MNLVLIRPPRPTTGPLPRPARWATRAAFLVCCWLVPLASVAGEVNGTVEFFVDEPELFDGFCPDLALEDFENSNAGASEIVNCPGPLESATGGGSCYPPGELIPGFRLDSSSEDGVLVVGPGPFGPSSLAGPARQGADTFFDFTDGGVTGVAFEVLDPRGPSTLTVEAHGKDGLLGATTVPVTFDALTFVGIRALADRIVQVRVLCGGVPEEIFDNLQFGSCDPCADVEPTGGCRVNGGLPGPCRGTSGDDVIIGTRRSDVIDGRGGDDFLVGLQGRDLLCGRGGDDWLIGSGGRDTLAGGRGDDILEGVGGGDTLLGQRGNDDLHGHSGNDFLDGGRGNDDHLEGGLGTDTCIGGEIVGGCE